MAALPQAQRFPHGHHAERGVSSRQQRGAFHPFQFGVRCDAQSGGKRQGEVSGAFQHLGGSDEIHHQRRGGTRLDEDRQRACAFRQPLPKEYGAVSQYDDQA